MNSAFEMRICLSYYFVLGNGASEVLEIACVTRISGIFQVVLWSEKIDRAHIGHGMLGKCDVEKHGVAMRSIIIQVEADVETRLFSVCIHPHVFGGLVGACQCKWAKDFFKRHVGDHSSLHMLESADEGGT